MATKRMSHANCTHPKTSSARARCRAARAERGEPTLTAVPTVPPTVNDLAAELSASLTAIRHAESRVESLIERSESIQEQLVARLINAEPKPTAKGENPIVNFEHRFRKGGQRYEYVALGIPEKFFAFEDEFRNPQHKTVTMWYISSNDRPQRRMDWKGLIQFIGAEDLATLKVVRSG